MERTERPRDKEDKADIQMIAGRLSSTKGVKRCKPVTTTTGENL